MFGLFSKSGPRYPDPAPDLTGKTCIITGSNAGIGYATALYFASLKCRVVLACRNETKANAARDNILEAHPTANVVVQILDLASLQSAKDFAHRWQTQPLQDQQIDYLICNGGVTVAKYEKTADGFELAYQTNYLTHFLLLRLLLPSIRLSPAPRIILVSSNAASWGKVSMDNINAEQIPASSWQGMSRFKTGMSWYGTTKLMQMLLVIKLQRLLGASTNAEDRKIVVQAVYPGAVASDMATAEHLGVSKLIAGPAALGMKVFARSTETGAMPTAWAALSEEAGLPENCGVYWDENCCKKEWINDACKDDALINDFYARSCQDAGVEPAL